VQVFFDRRHGRLRIRRILQHGFADNAPFQCQLPFLTFSHQVEQAIAGAAVPLPAIVQYGRIDAGRTLAILRPPARPAVPYVFRGTLGGAVRGRTYKIDVGEGQLTATLQFTRGARLTLELVPPDGKLVRVVGASPLELAASAPAGTAMLRVTTTARTKTSFVLHISYVLPAGHA